LALCWFYHKRKIVGSEKEVLAVADSEIAK